MNIGWYKKVQTMLCMYELPEDLTIIQHHTIIQWPMRVKSAIEKKHKEHLLDTCYKDVNGIKTPKTKTTSIIDKIENRSYRRTPVKEILNLTKKQLKTVMIVRFGMLQCGKNHQGTIEKLCDACNCNNDENHHNDYCTKWKDRNLSESHNKADFDDIYSSNLNTVGALIAHIESIWNTH